MDGPHCREAGQDLLAHLGDTAPVTRRDQVKDFLKTAFWRLRGDSEEDLQGWTPVTVGARAGRNKA